MLVEGRERLFAPAAELLAEGKILAIKGLGGFHLACRADDDHVVRRRHGRRRGLASAQKRQQARRRSPNPAPTPPGLGRSPCHGMRRRRSSPGGQGLAQFIHRYACSRSSRPGWSSCRWSGTP
ncbi:MAG: Sua5/YciO/YrdC/YwlC family protein [Planctomycetota bacterium]|nr:Sua5/YciO/YrdC/YwlC family protein [Planctomycetota bacterium]